MTGEDWRSLRMACILAMIWFSCGAFAMWWVAIYFTCKVPAG